MEDNSEEQVVATYDRHGNFTGTERVPYVAHVPTYDRHGNFTGNEQVPNYNLVPTYNNHGDFDGNVRQPKAHMCRDDKQQSPLHNLYKINTTGSVTELDGVSHAHRQIHHNPNIKPQKEEKPKDHVSKLKYIRNTSGSYTEVDGPRNHAIKRTTSHIANVTASREGETGERKI